MKNKNILNGYKFICFGCNDVEKYNELKQSNNLILHVHSVYDPPPQYGCAVEWNSPTILFFLFFFAPLLLYCTKIWRNYV